ncbi:MAG: hypothetical protein ABII79_13420 [bacterium]
MSTGKKVALIVGILFVPGIIMLAIEDRGDKPRSSSSRQTQTTPLGGQPLSEVIDSLTDGRELRNSREVATDPSISATTQKLKPAKKTQSTEHPTLGEKGVLRAGGSDIVPICVSEAVLKRFQQLADVGDETGIQQLIMAGSLWSVESGTRVHVIGTDWTLFEVRILDGSRAGRSGFVKRDFVWSH